MARVTVTAFTAARMLAIENSTIVGGRVTNDNLVLTTRDGTSITAGNVRGQQGVRGEPGGRPDREGRLHAEPAAPDDFRRRNEPLARPQPIADADGAPP